MARLILHVGPGKCGSSAIQYFFGTQKRPCVENTHYTFLDPENISEMNRENPGESITKTFTRSLSSVSKKYDVIIWSHEYLFQCPSALKNICNLARGLVSKVSIIGYSRRQSEFFISAYSQWDFRMPERIAAGINVLKKLDLDPVLFSGLERHLIALIDDDFYSSRRIEQRFFDWYASYENISRLIAGSGTEIKCGVLPKKGAQKHIIQDFCEKSGLRLRADRIEAGQKIVNPSFHQDIVEAIHNGVAFGLDMPGPHDRNEAIALLSSGLTRKPDYSTEFLSCLKTYIDSYFFSSNRKLCQEYGLSEEYFAPASSISKQEIMEAIVREGQQRSLNQSMVISNYRELTARLAEMCLNLTQHLREN